MLQQFRLAVLESECGDKSILSTLVPLLPAIDLLLSCSQNHIRLCADFRGEAYAANEDHLHAGAGYRQS